MNQYVVVPARFDTGRVLIGGFAATIVITLMMYFGASMMTGAPLDIAGELSGMIGAPWIVGMVIHFALGTVAFSFAYAFVVCRFLPGSAALRGVMWGVILWLVAMLIMGPMMGKGLFMGATPAAIASLAGHIAYGLTLGLIVPIPPERA
ncbi:MAG: DUF6789 family protein [Gammaproteobacteria bacterium]